MLLLFLLCCAFEVEAIWPFSSSSSGSGTQRIPQSFSGFIGNPGVNQFDIEAFTKNAAIRTNQENAMMAQLAAAKRVPNGEAEILASNVEVLMPRSAGGLPLRAANVRDFEGEELRNLLQANGCDQRTNEESADGETLESSVSGGIGASQLPSIQNGVVGPGFMQMQKDFLLRQQLENTMLPQSGSRFPFSDSRPLTPVPFLPTRKFNPIIPQGKPFIHDLESENEFSPFESVRGLQQPRPVRGRNDAFSDSFDRDSDFGRPHDNRGIVDGISDGFGSRVPRNKLL